MERGAIIKPTQRMHST